MVFWYARTAALCGAKSFLPFMERGENQRTVKKAGKRTGAESAQLMLMIMKSPIWYRYGHMRRTAGFPVRK